MQTSRRAGFASERLGKLLAGVLWEQLAAMSPEESREYERCPIAKELWRALAHKRLHGGTGDSTARVKGMTMTHERLVVIGRDAGRTLARNVSRATQHRRPHPA
jgi:hypothetical protein